MDRRLFVPSLFLLLALGCAASLKPLKVVRAASLRDEKTLVLYDATSGALPNDAFMSFTDFPPGAAVLTYGDGAAILDTSPSGSEPFAGWISGQAITPEFPLLDPTAGFQVNFTLQVENEAHTKNNRAGFSVILLDQDAKGVELAFWKNEIWAQNDDHTGNLFTHGEQVAFDTSSGLTEYQVNISGETYTLTANGKLILSGPVRDYSKFDGFPDPYETPNFLFMGDDTTTADVRMKLRFVSISGTESVLPTITSTSNNTDNLQTDTPQPTVTLTPEASDTPVPSPVPASTSKIPELCSSGWLLFAGTIPYLIVFKKNRFKKDS